MLNIRKILTTFSVTLLVVFCGLFILTNVQKPIESHGDDHDDHQCNSSCQERTVYRHKDWVNDGHWTCPTGWTLYNTDHCKKYYSGRWHYEDANWVDSSHWSNWSNWDDDYCHASGTKQCDSKVQHKTSCGEWVDGSCPHATPTATPTPTQTPSCTPNPTPSPEPSPTSGGSEPTPTPLVEVSPTPILVPETPGIGGPGGSAGAPQCNSQKPDKPTLLSVNKSGTHADITWTKVDHATHYTISYGTDPNNLQYGVFNTGDVTTYTINDLDPNANYTFVVYAVNNCMPSDPSSETGIGGLVLGASTMADTGSATDNLFAVVAVLGMSLIAAGVKKFLIFK